MQPLTASEPAGLLLFSPDHADELTALAMGAGWRVVICEADAAPQWRKSGARVVVVDARDALADALVVAALLGKQVAPDGGALLVLVPAEDEGAISRFFEAGATHFLVGASAAEFVAALRFARRHVERVGAGLSAIAVAPLGLDPPGVATEGGDAAVARAWLDARLASDAGPVGVMLVALTRFGIVNAAYGRAAGDQLLRVAERRVQEVARELGEATVARTGGSEFLLAAHASPERLSLAAARLSRALARPFAVAGAPALLGSRIGTADAAAGDDAAILLRRAGEALAAAKRSDSTVRRADAAAVAPIDALAVDLHRAIERGEVEMLFQPQVAMATGAIVGVEALARWEHPTLGVLGAELLFAAAERADLGAALSDHVQALALARAAAWPAALDGLRLSVNVTAADLARADFASRFLDRVAVSGFPVERLTAEVTETGLIAELDAAAALLATLRAAGCRVAIDDFGTGYSSLAYLKALPLDYLKIDKALAQDVTGSVRDRVVVRGVIEMARSLALVVIAEGVETREQRDLLAADGCNLYQGFLCAEALDVPALVRLVEGDRCDG